MNSNIHIIKNYEHHDKFGGVFNVDIIHIRGILSTADPNYSIISDMIEKSTVRKKVTRPKSYTLKKTIDNQFLKKYKIGDKVLFLDVPKSRIPKDKYNEYFDIEYETFDAIMYQPFGLDWENSKYYNNKYYIFIVHNNLIICFLLAVLENDTYDIARVETYPDEKYRNKGLCKLIVTELIDKTNSEKYKLSNAGGKWSCYCYISAFSAKKYITRTDTGSELTIENFCSIEDEEALGEEFYFTKRKDNQSGGYYKYIKYKTKYLNLKNLDLDS